MYNKSISMWGEKDDKVNEWTDKLTELTALPWWDATAALLAQPERTEVLWVPANASAAAPLFNQEEELRSLNLLPLLWFTVTAFCIPCHAHGSPASSCHNLLTLSSHWHEGGAGLSSHYIQSYFNDVTGHALLQTSGMIFNKTMDRDFLLIFT